jgi:HTH-type transcriptional regulator, sugar sensing transcriptional regulator
MLTVFSTKMANTQLIDILNDIGLTENESRIYFASLSLGPTSILKIAQAAELKRTTVYSVIESLKQKGLMNIQIQGFKKKFVAENPDKLEAILETRRKKLRSALPEFAALYNLQGEESVIKYYEGIESVKGVYESLIRDIKPHEDYLVMGNQDQWLNLDREFLLDFIQRRAKLPIKIRMLMQDTETGREFKKNERNYNSTVRILPEGTKLTTNLVITPQRVLIHQLTAPVIGIVIENKNVIQMHKETYEIVWNASGSSV